MFDDAATGQGLLNYFLRALNCGAIDAEALGQTGLTLDELALRSFVKILAARRDRLRRRSASEARSAPSAKLHEAHGPETVGWDA